MQQDQQGIGVNQGKDYIFDSVEKDKPVYTEPVSLLIRLANSAKEEGRSEKLGGIFDGCTVCPSGSARCPSYFEFKFTVSGYVIGRQGVQIIESDVMICPFGAQEIKDCPLGK